MGAIDWVDLPRTVPPSQKRHPNVRPQVVVVVGTIHYNRGRRQVPGVVIGTLFSTLRLAFFDTDPLASLLTFLLSSRLSAVRNEGMSIVDDGGRFHIRDTADVFVFF